MKLVDLSHEIEPDMPRFRTFPAPVIRPFWTHAESAQSGRYQDCTCEVTEVQFVTSMGTYLDAPFHFDPQGLDIAGLSLEQCVLPGVCVDVRDKAPRTPITAADLSAYDVEGRAVLLCTGWSDHWGDGLYFEHPYLAADGVQALLAGRVGLVGIDTLMIDDPHDPRRPAHHHLLQAGVPIVENLTNLAVLLGQDFTFYAVPAPVRGAAAFPVRAFASLI